MISFHIEGEKGFLHVGAYGDDGKIHITAYRRQGKHFHPTTVEIGKYSTTLAHLEEILTQAKAEEARVRKLKESA